MHELFREIAPIYMQKLMDDFDMSVLDAAAVFGNLGHESNGFEDMQEISPRAGRGGYGWAQWTGPRRVAFEQYAKRNGLKLSDPGTNYSWLFVELRGPEKNAVKKVKAARSLDTKVVAFEKAFERAGVKHYESRKKWARIALSTYGDKPKPKPGWFAILIRRILSWFGRS